MSKTKVLKIIIFTASYGGGHNSVANALGDYLTTHYARRVSVEVIDYMKEFAPVADKLLRTLYKQSTKRVPKAYGIFFDITDKLFTVPLGKKLSHFGSNKVREFIQKKKPDIVISVYPVPAQLMPEVKSPVFRNATVITDFGVHSQWIHPDTDCYFVPSAAVKDFLIEKGIARDYIRVTGIPLRQSFARKVNKDKIRKKFGLSREFTVLLMSGEYGVGRIKSLCRRLAQLPIQTLVICGRNKRLYEKVSRLARHNKGLMPFGFIKEVNELMRASNLLVGKAGGISVSEALACGLPIIIYRPIPGQEIFNVDYIVKHRAGFYARTEEAVVRRIKYLYRHRDKLTELHQNAKRLGRPQSTEQVCKAVLKSFPSP